MIRTYAITASLVLLICFGAACIIAVVDYSESGGVSPIEEFQRSAPLASGGILDLRNFDGNIEIGGWESEEIEIYAEKMIPRSNKARIQMFRWNNFTPHIDFETINDTVRVVTRSRDKRAENCVVDYYISVPHSINLKTITAREGDVYISDLYGEVEVILVAGDVVVENFSGSLTVSVNRGSVEASILDIHNEDEITLTSKQGDINLFLQSEVSGVIEGYFPNGNFFSEFEFEEKAENNKISVKIGEGRASISLTAMNGDIYIKKISQKREIQKKNPMDLTPREAIYGRKK